MSDIKQITAVARDRSGKGAARAVRRQGKVPAVIYGAGQPATGIALDFNETKRFHCRTPRMSAPRLRDLQLPRTR